MNTSRRLVVMRHAKAQPFAATDHDRVLTERGVLDAAQAGAHLAARGVVPDHAVVSSAVRSVMTWAAVARASGSTAEADVQGAVYTGSADVVLEALRAVPAGAEVVLFVGHNPSAAYLAHLLDDSTGDPDVEQQLLLGFPAAAMAVLEVSVPWSELGAELGRLVDFHVGKG